MRKTPEIMFEFDESIDYGNRIETLLHQIHNEDKKITSRNDESVIVISGLSHEMDRLWSIHFFRKTMNMDLRTDSIETQMKGYCKWKEFYRF